MAEVINGQIYEDIENLPQIQEIENGMYLIVETDGGTAILDYEYLLLGVDNVTFDGLITTNTTNIVSLSSDLSDTNDDVAAVNSVLNGVMTVAYLLSGGASGTSFDSLEYALPVNFIQSNSIDGNLANAPTTLNGVTSAANTINLNAGSWQVDLNASFDQATYIDLYDTTSNQVLLVSNYTANPVLQGTIALAVQSNLLVRGYASTTTWLGVKEQPFYVDTAQQMPLVATFQYLSSGMVPVIKPDPRT